MTKRRVEIDEELLAEARKYLGTKTVSETVNRALDEYIQSELRARHIDRLITMKGIHDLDDPEVMKHAWRSSGRRT